MEIINHEEELCLCKGGDYRCIISLHALPEQRALCDELTPVLTYLKVREVCFPSMFLEPHSVVLAIIS